MHTRYARLALAGALVAVVALATAEATPAVAQQPPGGPAHVDARADGATLQALDVAALARLGPGVRALPGTLGRGPRTLWRSDGSLTGPSILPPEQIVRSFLSANRDLYGVARGGAPDLDLTQRFTTRDGVTHLRFAQRWRGIEIFQSEIKAAVDADGRLLAVNGAMLPHGAAAPRRPSLSASGAVAAASASLDVIGRGAPPVADGPRGPDASTMFERGSYFRAPSARLVVFPLAGDARLAWNVTLPVNIAAWYEAVVDARSGELLYRANLATASGPEGQIFTTDPDDAAQATVPFAGTLSAPRDAWLYATETSGNNVTAGEDHDGDANVNPASSAIQHFSFGFADAYETSGGGDYSTDLAAAIANVFYWNNYVHDYYYGLGFNEAAGNFQQDNFGAGGLGGDSVLAMVQFGVTNCPTGIPQCTNNAFFLTLPDGTISFMVVLLIEAPYRYVDGAFAGDVLIHEYTHGLSNRLVGVGQVSGAQSGAMGEGWGDWFAGSITQDPVLAEYWNNNTATGIRNYAMDANPTTYGDLCHVGSSCEVHDDGEIWSATLWDIRSALITQYGASAGRAKAEQVIVSGMMLTPGNPTFLEARDAILQADVSMGGADHCLLWTAFATRGMGDSAASFGDSPDVAETFDLPLECAYPGPDSDGDGMPDSYETLHGCLNPALADASADGDGDGLTNGAEYTGRTNPCVGDSDADGTGDAMDNCPLVSNDQQNSADGNFVDLSPPKIFDDITWPNSDDIGDACDLDDDNDGGSDSGESSGAACAGFGSALTSVLNRDSDGDRTLDHAECLMGFNPNDATSKPGTITPDTDNDRLPDNLETLLDTDLNDNDSDNDGVLDGVEFRFYNTNPLAVNTDGDQCSDAKEIASINGDLLVNSADLSQVAQSFGNSSNPGYLANFDTNKDGIIASADLSFVAQQFGGC